MSRTVPQVLRLELGINGNAAPIVETRWKSRYLPLENALIDLTDGDSPSPQWFTKIHAEDRISFRLVDISDLDDPVPPLPSPPALIDFFFTQPETGERAAPFCEEGEKPLKWKISRASTPRWSPVFSRDEGQELPTWDLFAETPAGRHDELTFRRGTGAFRAFQLSVALEVHRAPYRDFFVFDPEMIVSDTDGPDTTPRSSLVEGE